MAKTNEDKPKLIWLNVLVFTITFLIAAIGVPMYAYFVGFNLATVIVAILATGYCGMSITAGYHRLWSHRAYEANSVVRFIFAIGGAFSLQNSILHWASDHRVHHRFVDDNEKDPYSAKRGFWYSHIGWMLREYQSQRYHDYKNVRDLQRDPIVMWQHKHYLSLSLFTNIGFPFLLGYLTGDVWGGVLMIGFLRLVVSHHVTFFINSLAHMWGKQPYNDQNTAKDNAIVALLTYGEGYHNFHHAFQYDYRNAIKWWQFDPTKWLIKTMSWLGLATNLKKVREEKLAKSIATLQFNTAKERLIKLNMPNKEEALIKFQEEYDKFIQQMTEFYQIKREWIELKLEAKKSELGESIENNILSNRYKELKESWLDQQKHWQSLVHQIA